MVYGNIQKYLILRAEEFSGLRSRMLSRACSDSTTWRAVRPRGDGYQAPVVILLRCQARLKVGAGWHCVYSDQIGHGVVSNRGGGSDEKARQIAAGRPSPRSPEV
jgi:hypothetical protein